MESWWDSIPPITKWILILSFSLTVGAGFGLLDPYYLILDWNRIVRGFELWRLITPLFFHGGLGFGFIIQMLFLVQYGGALEKGVFFGRKADFFYCVLLGSVILLLISGFFSLKILAPSLVMMLMYLWSRYSPNQQISFFSIPFQSFYLPWVMVAFTLLLGGSPFYQLLGILVGHIYFYFEVLYPAQGKPHYIITPQFIKNLFPEEGMGRAQGYAPAWGRNPQPQGAYQPNPQPQGYNWGRGQTLGRN